MFSGGLATPKYKSNVGFTLPHSIFDTFTLSRTEISPFNVCSKISSMSSMYAMVTGFVRSLYSTLHVSFIVNPVKRVTDFGETHLDGDEDSSLYLSSGHLHE